MFMKHAVFCNGACKLPYCVEDRMECLETEKSQLHVSAHDRHILYMAVEASLLSPMAELVVVGT